MYQNASETSKVEVIKRKIKRTYELDKEDIEYRSELLDIKMGKDADEVISLVTAAAHDSSGGVPDTIFHKTSEEGLVGILKAGSFKTGADVVISFSMHPLPKSERSGFATLEIKTPIDVCMIPVSYSPYMERNAMIQLYHIERANRIRETQVACKNVKTCVVADANFESPAYLSEGEISGVCLDKRGNKKTGECIKITEGSVVSILPECGLEKSVVADKLKDNGLEKFVKFVKEPLSEVQLRKIICQLYEKRGAASPIYKKLMKQWK